MSSYNHFLSFPIFLLQGSVSLYFAVFIEYFEVILFFTGNFSKSKLAGKFQMCFNEQAVRKRRRLSPVVWDFMHRCVGRPSASGLVHGTLWNCQPINNIFLQEKMGKLKIIIFIQDKRMNEQFVNKLLL